MRILVVEDEAKVARALKEGLEGEHYEVVVVRTGEEGFFRISAEVFEKRLTVGAVSTQEPIQKRAAP